MSMLTVSDVAKNLTVSESLVYALAEAGKLPGYRVGMGRGTWRFTEADVAAYLESCRSCPPSRKVSRPPLRRLQR